MGTREIEIPRFVSLRKWVAAKSSACNAKLQSGLARAFIP
jgi:hypothetical protein